jgi:ATP adenylyltransferase
MLCTAVFEPQEAPLPPDDIAAVYAVLKQWEVVPGERLYGFFNSGANSGASQPHRHVQFFPIENGRGRLPYDETTPTPEGKVWIHPRMPFKSFCIAFSKDPQVSEVVDAYQTLLKRCHELLGEGCSYNMGITKEWIVLLPRISADGGREGVGINGTVLAGEVMVKKQEDWDFFLASGLESVLRGIGLPNVPEESNVTGDGDHS